ncbi:MAG: GtrA-like protein [Pseudomonadota bacterium]|jgi:putative flippase GtrA
MSLPEKICSYFTKELKIQVLKYVGVSVAMYVSIFFVMYLAVDLIGISQINAYVITYAFAYIADYLINLRYLFSRDHSWLNFIKYITHILFFFACGVFVFKMLILTNMHYLIATFLSVIVLFPLRFLSYKFIVFRQDR